MSSRGRTAALATALLGLSAAADAQPADPWAAVRAAVVAERDPEALRRLDALPAERRAAADASYLRARLEARQGRLAEALAAGPVGETQAELPSRVRADLRRRRAAWAARAGGCRSALADLEALADRGPDVAALAAECTLAAGDLAAAETRLGEVLAAASRQVDTVAVRFHLAEVHLRSGRRDDAMSLLREIVVRRPEHPEAEAALEALEALEGAPPELTHRERLRRAARLLDQHRPRAALAEIERAGPPPSRSARRRATHLRGMALYGMRGEAYAEAARVLAESARLGGPTAAEDEFHAARALSRADQDRRAVRAYRRFAERHPDHARADEARYLAGWLELRHGVPGAERRMERFRRSAGRGELHREATWQLALRAFERRRHRRARSLFTTYAGLGRGAMVEGRGRYWAGRAAQEAGRRADAVRDYRHVLRVEPLHWYALLARERLVELDEDPGTPFPEPAAEGEPPAAPAAPLGAAAAVYDRLGLRRDAASAVRAEEHRYRQAGLRTLVAAYAAVGEATRPLRLVGGPSTVARPAAPGPVDRWRWQAAFPRPWLGAVAPAAAGAGLAPAHVYAVMRQESGFDPDVMSYAGAVGLLQLLPSTAAWVAGRSGIDVPAAELFRPRVNIRLGAALIGRLVDRYGIPLAFAAYNGGSAAVERWLRERGDLPLDHFVERISYTQTRGYVRRVTGHLAHYLYLAGPDGEWPMRLPLAPPAPDRVLPEGPTLP
ncbi:MAG: transglycosylase SLT domain-containing protein [Sandaracinaceae bacterium]